MSYWMYKCTDRKGPHNVYTGDWEEVFGSKASVPWGSTSVVPKLAQLKRGDVILAYQTNRNLLVGVATVTGRRPDGDSGEDILLRPVERVGVRVLPLKKAFRDIDSIEALQGGVIRTVYPMSAAEAKRLLRRARAVRASEARETRPARRRVLFARVGWMRFYAGDSATDPPPVGGGDYNRSELGHERFNFKPESGRVYGFVEPPGKKLSLDRILPEGSANQLDDILVVFFAKRSKAKGQVAVGWYRHATVHATMQWLTGRPGRARRDCGYVFATRASDAVVLPTQARVHELPRGKNGTGQSNVTYTLDHAGFPIDEAWIDDAVRWIEGYEGPNLMTEPEAEYADEGAAMTDLSPNVSGGQGFIKDSEVK